MFYEVRIIESLICMVAHTLQNSTAYYIDATGVILAFFYSTGVIFVYLYSKKLLFLCNEMINFYSTKIAMILYGIAIPVLKVSINYEIVSNPI